MEIKALVLVLSSPEWTGNFEDVTEYELAVLNNQIVAIIQDRMEARFNAEKAALKEKL